MTRTANGFQSVLKDNPSLTLFVKKMAEFDQAFCNLMSGGTDFNIRLEIRGNGGKLVHCRVTSDNSETLDSFTKAAVSKRLTEKPKLD